MMDYSEILRRTDHTLLTQTATWDDIKAACDDGVRFQTASVCIPPSFVARAAEYAAGGVKLCTVIGFPNGYASASAKLFEAADAVKSGADELDVVIHLGMVREGRYEEQLGELMLIKSVCGTRVLKVIVEACLLTPEEKIKVCALVSASGADYIKTSTGFSSGGATKEDVALFRAQVAPHVKVKASGGIRTFAEAEEFLRLGADRLGASALVRLASQSNP